MACMVEILILINTKSELLALDTNLMKCCVTDNNQEPLSKFLFVYKRFSAPWPMRLKSISAFGFKSLDTEIL